MVETKFKIMSNCVLNMINWKQRRVIQFCLSDQSVVEKIGLLLCDRLIKLITLGIYIETPIAPKSSLVFAL